MKRQHRNEKYQYGNYDRYYATRNEERWKDPRLRILRPEWFYNRQVLDIGCNDGTITLMIAATLNPSLILGLDIDYKLINRAVDNLVYLEKCSKEDDEEQERKEILQEIKTLPKSFQVYLQAHTQLGAVQNNKLIRPSFSVSAPNFPENICFRVENYIQTPSEPEKWETIMCLSTVKWIHLNWGDDGVKCLFTKIYESLVLGGYFILESQQWLSYKKTRRRTDHILEMYHRIKFRPNQFQEYLIGLGFQHIETLEPREGRDWFKRPIVVYQKTISL